MKTPVADAILRRARQLEPTERAAFVARCCAGDPELRSVVESGLLPDGATEDLAEGTAGAVTGAAAETIPTLPEARSATTTRERVGPYRLIEQIGSGGMGAIYLAVRDDDQFRKRAAVKLLRTGMESAELLARFRRERQILANLDHDNIARLLDGGASEDGLPYLVMEYVEGQPIDQYCDARRLSVRERLELFRAVCSAVHFAHQNLVVHRDIKPNNILVTAAGVPKLLDFGIAKLLQPGPDSLAEGVTRADHRILTPDYASPEQFRGEPITTASDVYSLGVLLYMLLTGHRPFRLGALSFTEVARIVCEQEPAPPSLMVQQPEARQPRTTRRETPEPVGLTREGGPDKLRRRLAGDLDNIVLMAMRKEPKRRYASVEQLSEDIGRHLEGRPVIARKDTLGYRLERFVARHRAAVVAATLLVLALVGGIAATSWQAQLARAERRRAQRALGDVRRLANAFIFDFHDAIEKLPGATSAREMVVKRALGYLDRLAQEAPDDPTLQLELAAAYARVGGIQWYRAWAHLGQTQGALESQLKALAIREAVVRSDPGNRSAREALAASHHLVGDVLEEMGRLEEALAHQRRSLALRQESLAGDPQSFALRRDVAINHDRIGDILGSPYTGPNLGDRAGALESYRTMQRLTEALVAEVPGSSEAKYWAGVSHENLARLRWAEGDHAGALELYRRQLDLFVAITHSEPTNAQFRRDLAVVYHNLGWSLHAQRDWHGSIANYRHALALNQELADADPANQGARRDMANAHWGIGDAQAGRGARREAAASYRRAATLARLGETREASRHARRSLALHRAEAEKPEATADDAHRYAAQLLGVVPSDLRDAAAALPPARRAVEMTAGREVSMLDTLARAQHANGDHEAAIATAERALELVPVGAPQRPELEAALARFKASRRPAR